MLRTVMNHNACQFAIELARIAADHKSERVVTFDLRGISPVTEYVVVCTGTSERQMHTVAEALEEYGKKLGQRPFGFAGRQSEVWTLIDFVDVVFHIFGRAHRDYYDLELLWGDAPKIDWARSESA